MKAGRSNLNRQRLGLTPDIIRVSGQESKLAKSRLHFLSYNIVVSLGSPFGMHIIFHGRILFDVGVGFVDSRIVLDV
jgi:hypothetical protein